MRIVKRDLEVLAERINEITASPKTMFGVGCMNVGHYYIEYWGGKAQLCQVRNKHGAASDVLRSGSIAKRDLYNRIHSFIIGLEVA